MRLTWSWRLPTAWYLTAAKNSLEGTPNFSSAAILKWQISFSRNHLKSPKTKIGTWFNVFRLFFVCFILLLGGWLRSLYKNQTEILSQSRHFIFVQNKLLRKYIMLQHISTDDLIIRILFSIRINSFRLVNYAFKTYILIKICLKIIDSILMRLFDAPARKKQR